MNADEGVQQGNSCTLLVSAALLKNIMKVSQEIENDTMILLLGIYTNKKIINS